MLLLLHTAYCSACVMPKKTECTRARLVCLQVNAINNGIEMKNGSKMVNAAQNQMRNGHKLHTRTTTTPFFSIPIKYLWRRKFEKEKKNGAIDKIYTQKPVAFFQYHAHTEPHPCTINAALVNCCLRHYLCRHCLGHSVGYSLIIIATVTLYNVNIVRTTTTTTKNKTFDSLWDLLQTQARTARSMNSF